MRKALWLLAACALLAGGAAAVRAEDGVLESVDEFLRRTSDQMELDFPLPKTRLATQFEQKIVYDDNIWQNDDHEPYTHGVEWDVSSETSINLGLVQPVNETYSKLFKRGFLSFIDYDVTVVEFMRRGSTDRIDQNVSSDLFGFLTDWMSGAGELNNLFYEFTGDWSDVSDPLDLEVFDLYSFTSAETSNLRRTAWELMGKFGYRGSRADWWVSAGYDRLVFDDDKFEQADHRFWRVAAQAGLRPEMLGAEKRLFVEYSAEWLAYIEDLLNNAIIHRAVLGLEGSVISKKVNFLTEAGVVNWRTHYTADIPPRPDEEEGKNGEDMDASRYCGFLGRLELEFRPWENLKGTRFYLDVNRDLNWSAISNYRRDRSVYLAADHELMPKKLLGTVRVGLSEHHPSIGPRRRLLEVGFTFVYKLLAQADLTFEYVHRRQSSTQEVVATTPPQDNDPLDPNDDTIETDGDFDQNRISIGIRIRF